MKILVTGAAGFIGSNFVHYWIERHPNDKIFAFDLLTYAGNRANLASVENKCCFIKGDIADSVFVEKLILGENIDIIVNFAAESHNSLAIIDPSRFFRTNVMGTQSLLEGARKADLSRFHHISTCEVYGDLPLDTEDEFTEESPYRPRTPYNASKAGADHVVRAYFETFNVPITISTCCNNYGPFQFPEKIIPLFVTLAAENKAIPLYSSTGNRREWIHVIDHCRAIERIIIDGSVGETYNVGTKVEKSIVDIADTILAALEKPESLKTIVPDRPGHDRRYLLDSSKIQNELAWVPQISFEKGIKETIQWYVDNRDWWVPLLEKAMVEEQNWIQDH